MNAVGRVAGAPEGGSATIVVKCVYAKRFLNIQESMGGAKMKNYKIYLDSPACDEKTDGWENALPVGNGRLGAMVFGYIEEERIQLNEEGIWNGNPQEISGEGFAEKLALVRKRLQEGKNADALAEELLNPYFSCVKSYETAGDLLIRMNGFADNSVENYRRELDVIRGVCTVSFEKDGVQYTREAFASYPAGCVVLRLASNRSGKISFTAKYTRPAHLLSVLARDSQMEVLGETENGEHRFEALLRFIPEGGALENGINGEIRVLGADAVTVLINIRSEGKAALPAFDGYRKLLDEHVKDFYSFMERCEIAYESDGAADALPVSERLRNIRAGKDDPALLGLYFQFGRYLLLSSSRGNSLPANLQGVWSDGMQAPWNADYHTNINLQMNYWHAETANLAECALPLFDYVNRYLMPGGEKVAREFYRCRGAVLHHLSDIYGFAYPADGLWGLWPMGGAWMCYAFWEHYLFSPDKAFLRDTAYPYMSDCVRFFLDYLTEDANGVLQSGPSTSPENRYYVEENGEKKQTYLCLSPTMDIEILTGLFEMYIKTEEILGINAAQAEEARQALQKLPPLKIGKYGQLMEWREDYDEVEPGHRHISHSFGLYPGWQINRDKPEWMDAIRKTIQGRLSNGGGHTGWSCAWLINLFARLGDGQGCRDMIMKLFGNSTKDNLFDSHPPFQIDGNFGAAAAFAEMLVQSHNGKIELLPALPDAEACQNGSFAGIRARGGVTVSATWKNGRIVRATLISETDQTVKVTFGGETRSVSLRAGIPAEI